MTLSNVIKKRANIDVSLTKFSIYGMLKFCFIKAYYKRTGYVTHLIPSFDTVLHSLTTLYSWYFLANISAYPLI